MKLDDFAEKLLDLTLSNRLLNFKESKYSMLSVKTEDSNKLYDMIMDSTRLEFFDIDKFVQSVSEIKDLNEIDIPFHDLKRHLENKVKAKQIIGYKNKISVKQVLKNITSKANESLTEKGINVLYLCFGFFKYKFDDSKKDYLAPIVLVPVKLTNSSKASPYYLELYEEEAIINPAIMYKMELDYKLKLREIDDNEDLSTYLEYASDFVKKLEWEVIDEVSLGLLSFHKLNMYMDLVENEDYIVQNPLVKNILGQRVNKEDLYSKYNVSNEFYNVVDADSSQLEAIKAIKNGESIVLQGPPGTGKSQTITNIIAQSIYDGKKVLFVSEKLAALNVVYDKLKKADLDEFCLALHSNKVNKKEVIAELYDTLNSPKTRVSDEALEEIKEIDALESLLDNYASLLHSKTEIFDMTPYEIFSNYATLDKVNSYDLVFEDVSKIKRNSIAVLMNEYEAYSNTIGYNYKDFCFYGINNFDSSKKKNLEMFNNISDILRGILPLFKELSNFNLNLNSFADLKKALELFNILKDMNHVYQEFFNTTKLENYAKLSLKLRDLVKSMNSSKTMVSKYYNEDIFEPKYLKLYNRYKEEFNGGFRILNKEYRQIKEELGHVSKSGKKYGYRKNLNLLKHAVSYYNSNKEFELENYTFKKIMGNEFNGLDTDFVNISEGLEKLFNLSKEIKWLSDFNVQEEINYVDIINKIQKTLKVEEQVLKLQKLYNPNIVDLKIYDLKDLYKKIIVIISDYDYISVWKDFSKLLNKLNQNNLLFIIDEGIRNEVPTKDIVNLVWKVYYKSAVNYLITNNTGLSTFNKIDHNRIVEDFISGDRLRFDISKGIIKSKLSQQKPNNDIVSAGSPAAIINKEYLKKRKQIAVRKLLNENAHFIQTLKPCFMMSPLSVSTYLESGKIDFDLVVFDEASQIFPQDAIGSIYRAKQLVVVGDSKQMPPSNFFNVVNTDDDSDEESISDFESILDVCSSIFKQYSLKWHYRSQSEDLIAFSNDKFYNNNLVTFPSSKKMMEDFGVEYKFVPNGVFDRKSKTNISEAKVIAQIVLDHFQKYGAERSVGVIAFSQSQQSCIENEVYNLLDKYKINYSDLNEPFFVKNLETVQGDERDTIIFSVGYAKDEKGKFIQNFGPLSKDGGERRLNVAITRAKKNVKLVSSIDYLDIDITRTNQVGTILLSKYLEYAKKHNDVVQKTGDVNDFSIEIKNFLESKGYMVDYKVGNSEMKIDLCIKDPETGDYIFAIETDGPTFKLARNTRDRERLRKEVLEKMGFRYVRIWSTDWYKNTRVAKDDLIKVLETKKDILVSEEREVYNGSIIEIEVEESFDRFIRIDDDKLLSKFKNLDKDFERIFLEYLNIEGPILEDELLKRILRIFDCEKMSNKARGEYELAKAMHIDLKSIVKKDGFISLVGKEIELRIPLENDVPRDIKSISIEEIASGLKKIILTNQTVSKEGLFKSLSKIMGYNRFTENIELRLDSALKYLIDTDFIRVSNDNISILDL